MKKKLVIVGLVFLFASVIFYPAVDVIIEDIITRNVPVEPEVNVRVAVIDYYMFFDGEQKITEDYLKVVEEKSTLRRGLLMYDKFYEKDIHMSGEVEEGGIINKFKGSYKELVETLLNIGEEAFKTEKEEINNDNTDNIKAAYVNYHNFVDITGTKPYDLKFPHEKVEEGTLIYKHINDITAFYGTDQKVAATVVYTKPLEVPLLKLKISLIGGFIMTLPLIAYYLGREIYSRFKDRIVLPFSKTLIAAITIVVLISFIVGAIYAYFFMAPLFVQFLYSSAAASGAQATYSIYEFVSFIALLTLIFGLVFEIPIVTLVLNRAGILRKEWLTNYRKHAYVGIFIVAAIITPPDVISQVIVATPMIIFYEISIVLVKLFGRNIKPKPATI